MGTGELKISLKNSAHEMNMPLRIILKEAALKRIKI
jgi:hypothetical protein